MQWDLANIAGISVTTGGKEENGWGLLVVGSVFLPRLELNVASVILPMEDKLKLSASLHLFSGL